MCAQRVVPGVRVEMREQCGGGTTTGVVWGWGRRRVDVAPGQYGVLVVHVKSPI